MANQVPRWLRPRYLTMIGQLLKTIALFGAAVILCIPCVAEAQSADERLRTIYTVEWKWRLEQFPGLEGITNRFPITCRK
jgi:hypothetical protein